MPATLKTETKHAPVEFAPGYALVVGPNGNLSVSATAEKGASISLAAFLLSNFNTRTAEERLALLDALHGLAKAGAAS